MNRMDWQAYLDGSLAPEQQVEAERMLKEDEGARKELEALKRFVGDIRAASLREEVPLDRLAAMIPSEKKPRFHWAIPTATLAAAAAIAAILFFKGAPTPVAEADVKFTSDVTVATNWVQPKMRFKVPEIDLGATMPLVRVHHGADSCCFDYDVHGRTYHINVLDKGAPERKGKPVKLQDGRTAYMSRGVYWKQGDLAFYVVGPDRNTALEVASAASSRLERA